MDNNIYLLALLSLILLSVIYFIVIYTKQRKYVNNYLNQFILTNENTFKEIFNKFSVFEKNIEDKIGQNSLALGNIVIEKTDMSIKCLNSIEEILKTNVEKLNQNVIALNKMNNELISELNKNTTESIQIFNSDTLKKMLDLTELLNNRMSESNNTLSDGLKNIEKTLQESIRI